MEDAEKRLGEIAALCRRYIQDEGNDSFTDALLEFILKIAEKSK